MPLTTQSKLKAIVNEKNQFIDSLLAQFEANYNKLAPTIEARLRALIRTGDYNFEAIQAIFTEAGFDVQLGAFVESYGETIQYTRLMAEEMGIGFGMSERGLDLIGRFQEQNAINLLTAKDNIAKNLANAALKWESEEASFRSITKEMSELIQDGSRRLVTEAQTGISTFERMVKNEQFKEAGIDKFQYIGPLDDRTRDVCREVLQDPRNQTGFTRSEIDSLPVDMVGGGGWNCRHDWLPFVEGI